MATIALPYPDIEFIPLDVLTAAEQNQLIANINALADFVNGLSNGDNLSIGAISPSHLAAGLASYFTREVGPVGKWIDGSDIYKKTIEFGTLPNNMIKSVPHGITGISTVIDYWCVANSPTEALTFGSGIASGNGFNLYLQKANGGNVNITTNSDRTAYVGFVTLFYTKSP